ncbi:MAG: preprotein translocase subunit SecG [Kordiimonadales bacterium]|nr:MAG: preprotein translocase subunit SecG [Kordiimonadales bacterium]
MEIILLTTDIILAIAMVITILLQRSEGGALGIGSGSGGFMTARGAGDVLTKSTKYLAILFLVNTLALGWLSANSVDDFDRAFDATPVEQPAEDTGDKLPEPDGLPEPGEG